MIQRTEREKAMAMECMQLITKKMGKSMSPEEYYSALKRLDEKFPMARREPPLTIYQLTHWREINMGADEEHMILPMNFWESAEMYIRHRRLVDKENPEVDRFKSRPQSSENGPEDLPF